jgi:diacylglycerol kinase family enzyme
LPPFTQPHAIIAILGQTLRAGTQGEWDEVRTFSTKDLTITTRGPRDVNLDGELKTKTPLRVTIREKAIRVFVAGTARADRGDI